MAGPARRVRPPPAPSVRGCGGTYPNPTKRQAVDSQVERYASSRSPDAGGPRYHRLARLRRARPRALAAAGAAAMLTVVLAACGSSDGTPDVPTRVPATPVAGAQDAPEPAGNVILSSPDVTGLAAFTPPEGVPGAAPTIVVQQSDPDELTLYAGGAETSSGAPSPSGAADVGTPMRSVDLPDGASPLTMVADADGPAALVPAPGKIVRVDLTTGRTRSAGLDGDPVSAVALPDGRYAVGTDGGTVYILGADLHTVREITGFVSADSLAAAEGSLVVLDAHQTSVTVVDPDTGDTGAALRVGKGATRIASDGTGPVVAIDTDGGQLLVFGVDPLVNRQMAPIGDSPSALAMDTDRALVWVTFTGTDEVAAFDLSSGEPVEEYRLPTVDHPTSVAVGPHGDVYVGSGTDGGVVRIDRERIR